MAVEIFTTQVDAAWVDYNGHMNDGEYARVFSWAQGAFTDILGLDDAGRRELGVTIFTLESHLCYLAETHEGESLNITIDMLDRDAKRLHLFFAMHRADGVIAATSEQMIMAMSRETGRSSAFPARIAQALDAYSVIARDDWPAQAGRRIGIRRR